MKLIIGVGTAEYDGWISMQEDKLNVLCKQYNNRKPDKLGFKD